MSTSESIQKLIPLTQFKLLRYTLFIGISAETGKGGYIIFNERFPEKSTVELFGKTSYNYPNWFIVDKNEPEVMYSMQQLESN